MTALYFPPPKNGRSAGLVGTDRSNVTTSNRRQNYIFSRRQNEVVDVVDITDAACSFQIVRTKAPKIKQAVLTFANISISSVFLFSIFSVNVYYYVNYILDKKQIEC